MSREIPQQAYRRSMGGVGTPRCRQVLGSNRSIRRACFGFGESHLTRRSPFDSKALIEGDDGQAIRPVDAQVVLPRKRRTPVLSIELPRLLGERHPTAARTRRAIRNKLLARRSLAATDHKAIRQSIEDMLSEEIALRDGSWNNRKDEQTRRQCLAHIAEAVYLASDDEGHHALWLRDKCIELTGITKYTALLPLALKAFGPYVYNGDPESCRISDKKVSRDYKSIIRVLSPDVLPPDLVSKWSQPGCGINVSSRPQKVVCGEHPVPLVAELKMHERAINQSDGTMIYLVHKKGSRS